MIEVDTLDECAAWLSLGDLRPPAAFRGIDLRDAAGFESGSFDGCLFLSCVLTPAQAGFLTTTGATVLRDDSARPFTAHRTRLYSVDELYAGFDPDASPESGAGYASTFDAQVYEHWVATGRQNPPMIDESLARRLHDHSITEALDEQLVGRRPVAIMGGHGLERADPDYVKIARIARSLAKSGYLMLSGGGPGAMEATHLGVWMAHFDDTALDDAIEALSPRPADAEPGHEYADADWLTRAFTVRRRWPLDDVTYTSIGIPTWMYGHEPPAAFATMVAKYFANSVREEGLLAIATHGVVFAPGSAGTIQEIFQDTTQNHYASYGPASPMILLGTAHWTSTHPVWPLLQSLAGDHGYRDLITLTDDEAVVLERIERYERAG